MRPPRHVRGVALALGLVTARDAGAQDTSYGRLQGDVAAAASAGVTAGAGTRAAFDLRARYLQTAGIFTTFEQGPEGGADELSRVGVVGLELRPLFLGRWLQGLEVGTRTLDLAIDSLGLELGFALLEPGGRGFASRTGLSTALGFELPLLGGVTGAFLAVRAGLRLSESALAGRGGPPDEVAFLTFAVGYQRLFGALLVDLGDHP